MATMRLDRYQPEQRLRREAALEPIWPVADDLARPADIRRARQHYNNGSWLAGYRTSGLRVRCSASGYCRIMPGGAVLSATPPISLPPSTGHG
jgi:hypothetical protein